MRTLIVNSDPGVWQRITEPECVNLRLDAFEIYIPIVTLPRLIDALRQLEQDMALCTTDISNGDPAIDQNRRHDS